MPKERKEQPTSLPTSQNGSFKQKQPKASRWSSNGSGGRRPSADAVDVADDGDDEHDEESVDSEPREQCTPPAAVSA